ncbi:MAG: hypothetical protein ACW98U_03415 [Candidatus Thorarchaeota archaeon]|jgi:hypothetical protein
MKKIIPFTFVMLFFMGLLLVPQVSDSTISQDLREESVSILSEGVERNVRVAIYDESNTSLSAVSYTACPWFTNNIQPTADLLTNAGYDVSLVTTDDILNHELLTLHYDVFVLVNNVPLDPVYDYVYEFWLGGGGMMSFNGGMGFLMHSGIFSPDTAGVDEFGGEWVYLYQMAPPIENYTIVNRHPTAQDYHIGDIVPSYINDSVIWNPAYSGYSNAHEFTPIADPVTTPGLGFMVAVEPDGRAGGRAIQIPCNGSYIEPGMESIIVDSVDWLTPRPKGRIVFDLSHIPRLGVDPWDTMTAFPDRYSDARDLLEMRGYTFDKLYGKASGNLTMTRLSSYDMLILVAPDFNYTASEVTAVQNWVSAGGGLLVLSEGLQSGPFLEASAQINSLMDGLDLQLADVPATSHTALFTLTPLSEGCTSISHLGNGFVNYSGNGFEISYEDSNTIVAGTHFGEGRAILAPDINFPENSQMGTPSNENLMKNIVNWLTAATADVLVYVNNLDLSNPYEGPVVAALNDLGIPFYLTASDSYMNLSLYSQQWGLVILDSAWPGVGPYLDDISSYLDTGGDLLVSWHMMHVYTSHPLYSRIGFGYAENYPNQQPFYIWTPSHGIFNYPNDYGALNFTPGYDIGDEGDLMTVYANATALAGLNETVQPGNATIVLGLGGQVLWNSYLIDQLTGDLDDSTYTDDFELWENEIAFMLQPSIDHPADVEYEEGATGNSIVWTPSSHTPWNYVIKRDSVTVESGGWNGGSLSIIIDGLANGTYVYEITVFDNVGYSASDSVNVIVTEAPPTTPTTPTTGPGVPLDPTTLLIIAAAAGVVIVIVLVVVMRKKK